ncbi:MAG: hypothetical protein LAO19_22715, partial [Acidobacteriia bacterium]|nr:hypothetical protein [Terriglobia bacterium]
LDGGLYSQASTQQLMLTRLWAQDARLTGFTYGFWELNFNGQRILYHAGATLQFHSLLMLIPDQRLGFYFSYNTETANNLWDKSLFEFMDHYFPQKEPVTAPPADFNRIGSADREGAALAIRRDNHFTGQSNFTALLGCQLQRMVVDLFERPGVGRWVACNGIVLAVELASPLAMRGVSFTVDTVHRTFHAVADGLILNGQILGEPGIDLRLRLVELPCSQVQVGREAQGRTNEQYYEQQEGCSQFHIASKVGTDD